MAGLIPEAFIDELMARVDIVEVVGGRVELKKAGSNYQALCPFHTEKTPSFTVSPSKQFYHCFGCGAHGTAIRFLMEYDRLEFRDAVEQLAHRVGLELPKEAQHQERPETADLYNVLDKADQQFRQWLRESPHRQVAVDYLKKRGLSGQIAAHYGVGYAPPGWDNLIKSLGNPDLLVRAGLAIAKDRGGAYDRFRDRVMFPIRDRRGRVVGFGGRVLGDGEPKYLNSPETPVFHKGRELYGLYDCLQESRHPDHVLVVEGYMDVLALAQYGITNAVATLGTATGTEQVERLFQTTREIIFCFDGDRAGRQAAWRALENTLPALRDGRQVRFLFLPEGEDPDTLVRSRGKDFFAQELKKSQALSDFLFRSLEQDVDMASMDGRARLAEQALPMIRKVPPGVFRSLLEQELGKKVQLDPGRLEQAAGNAPAGNQGRRGERRRPAEAQRRTPVRLAVALLLQKPGLATMAGDLQRFDGLEVPGLSLLLQLLELLKEEPHLSTGAILERFREHPLESALWKLAAWEHQVPENGMEAEFQGAFDWLSQLIHENRLQYFHEKLQADGLTDEERREWQALLRAKAKKR